MKREISYFLALTMMFVMTATDLSAQTRITFGKGAKSKTISGTISFNNRIAGPAYEHFIVRASTGDTVVATVSSRNGKVVFPENDQTKRQIRVTSTGNVEFSIFNGGESKTKYTLTVSIR